MQKRISIISFIFVLLAPLSAQAAQLGFQVYERTVSSVDAVQGKYKEGFLTTVHFDEAIPNSDVTLSLNVKGVAYTIGIDAPQVLAGPQATERGPGIPVTSFSFLVSPYITGFEPQDLRGVKLQIRSYAYSAHALSSREQTDVYGKKQVLIKMDGSFPNFSFFTIAVKCAGKATYLIANNWHMGFGKLLASVDELAIPAAALQKTGCDLKSDLLGQSLRFFSSLANHRDLESGVLH